MAVTERVEVIRDYLTLVAGMSGWPARQAQFLLDQGEVFPGRRHDCPMDPVKECYQNAAALALSGEGTYYEGYAVGRALIPMAHAWLMTADGVLDTTWRPNGEDPTEWAYLGVGFPTDRLAAVLVEKGTYGLLDWPGLYEASV